MFNLFVLLLEAKASFRWFTGNNEETENETKMVYNTIVKDLKGESLSNVSVDIISTKYDGIVESEDLGLNKSELGLVEEGGAELVEVKKKEEKMPTDPGTEFE